ncbi:MAG: signal peptidase I [Psychrobacillus sp.]|uniref:signal peptidase I n=1 Tax=Psychrobacillus sp. FSL K6-4046 TaxID=2921550 RepID=UPI00315B0645
MKKIMLMVFCISFLVGCVGAKETVYEFDGISMSPTIKDEQKVLVDKGYYKENEINRDDIVLFNLEENEHFKRVIGLPNELIQIQDGTIYIDSKPLESEYSYTDVWEGEIPIDGIQLKNDEYFVIGDSLVPLTSKDSRSVGPIAKEDILGKVVEIK